MKFLVLSLILVLFLGCGKISKTISEEKTLLVFAGITSKPALEELAVAFKRKTAVKVELNFGSSGAILSQIMLSRRGDIYFPASKDFMDKALDKGIVVSKNMKVVAYLVPAIFVARGNPKKIKGLDDLGKAGVKVGSANPDSAVIGAFTAEIFNRKTARNPDFKKAIQKNIITQVKNAEDLNGILMLGQVDAIINWSVFGKWHADKIEMVRLARDEIPRVTYFSIGITRFARDKELSRQFSDFVVSPEGKRIFKKHGYIIDRKEVEEIAPGSKI